MMKIKYEMILVLISDITGQEKNNSDLNILEQEKKYKLKNIKAISPDACSVFNVIHPVVVISFREKSKRRYKIIANQRTLEIAKSVLGSKSKIPVILIKNRSQEIIRNLQEIDCVGTPFCYSLCNRRNLKVLIKRTKDAFKFVFPSLKRNVDIAEAIGVNAKTFFNNSQDILEGHTNKNGNINNEKHKEDFNERYSNTKVKKK